MTRLITSLLIAVVVIPFSGAVEPVNAQTIEREQLGGMEADVNCPNLQSEADAQTLYEATLATDGRDVYGLDGTPQNDAACDGSRTEIDTEPLASCADLRRIEHAEALFDAGGADDPYGLDPNENGIPCDAGMTAEPEPDPDPDPAPPSDLPPRTPPVTNTTGCDSTLVENGRVTVCAGQDIEVRPFDFDAFAASAQDGFGHFSGSNSSGPISIGVPSSSPASGASGTSTTQQPAGDSGNRVRTSEQSAQKVRKQKRKKTRAREKKGKRGNDGKRHRDRERRGAAHRAR